MPFCISLNIATPNRIFPGYKHKRTQIHTHTHTKVYIFKKKNSKF